MVFTRDMNKQTRKALLTDLGARIYNADTSAELIMIATDMADAASQGRSETWKGACTMAGRRTLAKFNIGVPVPFTDVSAVVQQGYEAMVAANK